MSRLGVLAYLLLAAPLAVAQSPDLEQPHLARGRPRGAAAAFGLTDSERPVIAFARLTGTASERRTRWHAVDGSSPGSP